MSVFTEIYVGCNQCPVRLFVGFAADVKPDAARRIAREAGWKCVGSKQSPTGRAIDLCPQCAAKKE